MNSPKLDAMLACRVTGTRLYGKPLQLLDIENRITILEYLVRYLEQSKSINSICLAISDEKANYGFAELAEKHGWKYVFGDPVDVLGRILKAVDKFDTDMVFRITTDCPFVYYNYIDELYEQHLAGDYDLSKFSNLPEGAGYSIQRAEALRICHEKGSARHRSELINSYIFDNQEEFRLNIRKPEERLRRPEVRITVDYPEDLVFCRRVYKDLKGDEKLIEISDIIDYWDRNEEIRRPLEEIGIDWGHGRLWE